jgi:beta-galactosidase
MRWALRLSAVLLSVTGCSGEGKPLPISPETGAAGRGGMTIDSSAGDSDAIGTGGREGGGEGATDASGEGGSAGSGTGGSGGAGGTSDSGGALDSGGGAGIDQRGEASGSAGVDGSVDGTATDAARETAIPPYTPPTGGRSDIPINDSWRFLRSDAAAANTVGFDDSSWTAIALPHTWNNMDGQDGDNNYYRGIGWYRRHYLLAADAAGKNVYLQFDGANIITDVWVNGTQIGQHRGGFARFRFDVTAALRPGADNVIAVKVSNAQPTDVAPLNADFTFFGGLYRDVHLLVTDKVHIDTEDYGSEGVYLETSNVSAASANLRARVRVRNNDVTAQDVTVTMFVVHADRTIAAKLSTSAMVPAGATVELAASGVVTGPRQWDGLRDPYLYTAYTEISPGTRLADWVAVPLGFRSFAIDANAGFSLNGKYLDLHGVNRHQDRLDMGWALTQKEHDEDMALIEEMGATAIRLAHYQHAPYFYDLCDRRGMVVWAEIPLVNAITNSAAFSDNARRQLTELIRQNFNHPSIVFWGIGNEQRTDDAPTNTLLTQLNDLVHSEDATRLSTYAHCCTSDTGGLPAHADVVGYNEYFGWYDAFGTYDQFAAWADNLHTARPAWKIGVSEWGAGGAISQHAENPPQPDPYGLVHPEEYQSLVHEAHWKAMKVRPFLWSKFIWNMFDFAVDSRNEGEHPGRNDKGVVTYDRKTRKDSFYWFKANWTEAPLVYITSRRWSPRTAALTTVKIYSNTSSVELTVNGTSLGSRTSTDRIFTFTGVTLRAGDNVVEAIGTSGNASVTDRVTWTLM